MTPFVTAIKLVLAEEGGLSDHAADPGGLTNLGVTHATLDEARKQIPGLPASVRDLTTKQAITIYLHLYWYRASCNELPAAAGVFTFDAAVQHGTGRAVMFLQEALGLVPDGAFGPRTLAKVQAVKDWPATLREMAARRMRFYMLLDATDDVFGLGWSRRLLRIYDACKGLL